MAANKTTARKRGRSDQPGLTREQIVEAALKIIDGKGVEAFTMRELAQELGVYHRALYWHFPAGRNALLGAVAAGAFEDVLPVHVPLEDWRDWLRELFRRYRASLRKHPNVAPLVGAQIVSNAGVDPLLVEQLLQALTHAGFRDEALIAAYNAVIAAMLGYVTLELAPEPQGDPGWAEAFERQIRSLDPRRYPLIAAHRDHMINQAFILRWRSGVSAPLSPGFEAYLDVFIAGIEGLARDRAGS